MRSLGMPQSTGDSWMGSMKLPDGYLLPEGKTMADVRRLDLELLASDGLDVKDLGPEDDRKDGRSEDA